MTARKEGLLAWVCCLVFLSTCVGATEELGMAWKKGASYQDATIAAVVGDASGCTFVTGATSGDFGPGSPNLGQRDAYLSKYNADGDVMWVIPLGTEGLDSGSCLTVDAEGNCYVGGQTEGSLAPNLIANTPQLVSKLLPAAIGCEVRGSALSAKKVLDVPQHASEPFSPLALATNLSLDFAAKSVLKPVVDTQQDAFLAKISSEGTCVWIRQFGSAHADGACRVRLDQNGNCYVAGNTTGCIDRTPEDCAGQCPFVAKFDSTGQLVWISQVRDSHAQAGLGVGVDPNGTVALAGAPGYVATFDANGVLLETRPLEHQFLRLLDACVDDLGHVYLAGETEWWARLIQYDLTGQETWSCRFQKNRWSVSKSIVLCPDGSHDMVTAGCQGGPSGGRSCQAFLRRYSQSGDLVSIFGSPEGYCGARAGVDRLQGAYAISALQSNHSIPFIFKAQSSLAIAASRSRP